MGTKCFFKKLTVVKFLGLKLFEIQTNSVDRAIEVDDDELLDEIYLSELEGLWDEREDY